MSPLRPEAKSKGCRAIDDNADARDNDHRVGRDGFRFTEALNRLPGKGAYGDEQKNGVEERCEDGRGAQAIGEALRGRSSYENAGDPRDHEAQHVAEIVSGVGKKSDRIAERAVDGFDNDKAGVESNANRKSHPEAG